MFLEESLQHVKREQTRGQSVFVSAALFALEGGENENGIHTRTL